MSAASALLPFPAAFHRRPLPGHRSLPSSVSKTPLRIVRNKSSPLFADCNISVQIQGKCGFHYGSSCCLRRHATVGVKASQVKLEDSVDDEACELVSGVDLVLGEGQDSIRAHLLKAVKNNNGTGLLMLSDALGFEDSATRDFAYRVACNGYNVLVPDLFRGKSWNKDQPVAEFEPWLMGLPTEQVTRDISVSTKWLIDEFAAAGITNKLGVIGFCFGGARLIEALAQDEQRYFGTGVCFYGSNMDTSLAKDVKIPVLFISGDDDPFCTISTLQEMEKNIGGSRVVIYNGRGHGFVHRPESQEEDADAEDAFAIMRNWLHDSLLLSKDHEL